MAKLAGRYLAIYYAGFELTGWSNSFDSSIEYDELDVTSFQDGCKNSRPGFEKAVVSIAAFLDPADNKSHEALRTHAGSYTNKELLVLVGQNTTPTVGDPALMMQTKQFNYQVPAERLAAVIANATFQSQERSVWGVCLVNTTITNTTNGTAVNNVYATLSAAQAILQVLTVLASDTYTIKCQDSDDNVTFADLNTFTLDGSALGSERDAIAAVASTVVNHDMESNITGWTVGSSTDTGAAVSHSSAQAAHGSYSCLLTSGVDTAHTNFIESNKLTGIAQNDIVAIDLCFYAGSAWPDGIKIYVIEYDGGDVEQARTIVGTKDSTTGSWVRFRDCFKCTNAGVVKAAVAIGEPTAQNFSGGAVTLYLDRAYFGEANVNKYVRYQATRTGAAGESLQLAIGFDRGRSN